ncbi:MAG: TMEM175 family protein [Mucilaginibacter sp.]
MRVKAANLTKKTNVIKWRSHEPSRIETFSDAVFAFALTLIIVSLEVPKSFDELVETMKGTLSFAVCFALLFNIWNSQNIFFRRYGLKDEYTITLNAILLFIVLIYTYPLKFLFVSLFSQGKYMLHGHEMHMILPNQKPSLMVIYGIGFTAIYMLFYLMYRRAQKMADDLKLTPEELFESKTFANINILCAGIGILSITTALLLPLNVVGASGYVYFLIPVVYSTWFSYRGKKRRRLFAS